MVNPVNRVSDPEEITVASGQTKSDAVNLGGRIPVGAFLPAGWTGTLSFEAASAFDGTYVPVHADGGVYQISVTADTYTHINWSYFFGVNFLKVVSSASQVSDSVVTMSLGRPTE